MFGDNSRLEEMIEKTNQVSPSFCMAKWMHSSLHLLNGRTHSCYLPPTHKIPLDEIKKDPSALHNTSHKKEMRRLMKEGQRPKECSICWAVEDLPGKHYSDRHYRSVESWTLPYFEKIKNAKWDENINPSYLEVSWSSACNFKCMYCSPIVSSEWMKEVKSQGGYQLSDSIHQYLPWFESQDQIPLDEASNPYIEAFWRWWPDLVKDLVHFRVTGGEPLLSQHTFKLLEWFRDNPQPHIRLSINSNLGVPQKQFDRFMLLINDIIYKQKIKTHTVHTSIDTWGEQAEYIRHGMSFVLFENYLTRIFNESPNTSIALMCTFNALSIARFKEFIDWVISKRQQYYTPLRGLHLDIPHLQSPQFFSCQILTADFQDKMRELILYMQSREDEKTGVRRAEIQKMQRILGWMQQPLEPQKLKKLRADFYLFFQEHDRRRNRDFLKTFPEMADFYAVCYQEHTIRRAEVEAETARR